MKLLLGMILATVCPALYALSTLEYAKKCEQKIGVPVPRFNCKDAQATLVKAKENGREIPEGPDTQLRCDTPSHGRSFCQTGTRLLKYTDLIRRDGREERISTVIMCRREPGDSGVKFSDVAVIQLNETKNLSCWFSKQGMEDSTNVPSPSAENPNPDYWGKSQPNINCMRCHDGATFIYSPLFAQIKGDQGGYIKRPGEGAYRQGGGNELPRSNLKVGPSCAFDMPVRGLEPQPQLKIQLTAYESRFGRSDRTKALPTTCTECHYIGSGGMGCRLATDSMTGSSRQAQLSDWAQRGINHRWMPPQESRPYWPRNFLTTDNRRIAASFPGAIVPDGAMSSIGEAVIDTVYARQAEAYFEPAKRAIQYCCDNPNDREICGGKFQQTPANACYALEPPQTPPASVWNDRGIGRHSYGPRPGSR